MIKKFLSYLFIIFFIVILPAFSQEETLILLDASASMLEPFGDKTKIEAAAEEVINILKTLPDNSYVGLRIIGIVLDENLGNYFSNPNLFCKATSLLVPIKTNNIENISERLNSILPLGTTPLVYSINEAINNDFSSYVSFKHIILITDGVEECGGNLCGYIAQMSQQDKNLKIDVLAMNIGNNEFYQLKCLSDYTAGTIINTNTPDEIDKALMKFFTPVKNIPSYSINIQHMPEKNREDIQYKDYVYQFNY